MPSLILRLENITSVCDLGVTAVLYIKGDLKKKNLSHTLKHTKTQYLSVINNGSKETV